MICIFYGVCICFYLSVPYFTSLILSLSIFFPPDPTLLGIGSFPYAPDFYMFVYSVIPLSLSLSLTLSRSPFLYIISSFIFWYCFCLISLSLSLSLYLSLSISLSLSRPPLPYPSWDLAFALRCNTFGHAGCSPSVPHERAWPAHEIQQWPPTLPFK